MDAAKELAIINKLVAEAEDNYNKKQKELKDKKIKKELYEELFQDKINGILGG